jgi:putative ATP-dependent endonuclease of the OLD family
MGILIDTVRIAGFRGIQDVEMSMSRITVLLGTNNSGKTSLLKALHLALGDYSRYLSEEDFFISSDDKRANEILVDIRIISVDENYDRTQDFEESWQTIFQDKIKSEANGYQYLPLRTCSRPNQIKGGFETTRSTLERWPSKEKWRTEKIKLTKMSTRFDHIPFMAIEAQRDIHRELKDKSSSIGRILSSVKYNEDEVIALESLIKEINDNAVNQSGELTNLKANLENLSQSFDGSGTAEITPFPKKIRDLSKHFSIHYGDTQDNTFSIEYHGMGTRSWASILTVRAFIELNVAKHEEEHEPFFPFLSAEEPEAHLHPCAQKTLYRQLSESEGQVIFSTHSPYLAAMANQSELRCLKRDGDQISVRYLETNLEPEDRRRLQREVIHSRGEILFSKVLVLCEGETEEQALPLLFERYFQKESFVLGVSFIGVGGSGKKYLPFLSFAKDFSIPVFIFSDGEQKVVDTLKENYVRIFGETDIKNCPNITILNNTCFEGYLLESGFEELIKSVIDSVEGIDYVDKWIERKHGTRSGREETSRPPCSTCGQRIYQDVMRDFHSNNGCQEALLEILKSKKTSYAPLLVAELCKLEPNQLPQKVIDLFNNIKEQAIYE